MNLRVIVVDSVLFHSFSVVAARAARVSITSPYYIRAVRNDFFTPGAEIIPGIFLKLMFFGMR